MLLKKLSDLIGIFLNFGDQNKKDSKTLVTIDVIYPFYIVYTNIIFLLVLTDVSEFSSWVSTIKAATFKLELN